jgi:hypothetical protein
METLFCKQYKRKITVSLLRSLEKRVIKEEISYSRMVELLNEHIFNSQIIVPDNEIEEISENMVKEGFFKTINDKENEELFWKMLKSGSFIPEYPNLYIQIKEAVSAGIKKGISLHNKLNK